MTPSPNRVGAVVLVGLALYIGMICFQAYAPFTFIFRDGAFYAQTNRSIAESFTLRQEAFQPASWYDGSLPWYRNVDDAWSNVSVGANGEWYPKHSYLMPVFSTPFYVLFGPFGLLLFNGLALVLALFAGYRLASLYAGAFPSAVAVFLVASAPLVPYLAYSYSHDVFCAALVAGGLALLARRRYAWGGLLLGLSIYAKLTNVLIAAPVGFFLTIDNRRGMLKAAVAAAVPLAVYAAANTLMYGDPFTISYNRILTVVNGRQSIVSYSNAFDMPFTRGWHRFFADSHEGELARMAWLPLLAFACLPLMGLRAWGMALGLAISTILFLYTFARYHYGGARFFMPWLAVSTVPLAVFLERVQAAIAMIGNRFSRSRRRAFATIPAAVGLPVIAIAWILGVPSGSMTMSGDIEHLSTALDGHPCDYFNMTHMKWECSRLDPGGAYLVGRALGGQCAFAGRPMVWAPANPARRTRVIEWTPARQSDRFRVLWGLDGSSTRGSVRFTVRAGDRDGHEFVTQGQGNLSVSIVEDMTAGPGRPVKITIAPGSARGLNLCLDIEAL